MFSRMGKFHTLEHKNILIPPYESKVKIILCRPLFILQTDMKHGEMLNSKRTTPSLFPVLVVNGLLLLRAVLRLHPRPNAWLVSVL